MKKDYKDGDIVELINYKTPDSGEIGYYMNQYGMIPKVGHRYYVSGDCDDDSKLVSLICGVRGNGDPNLPRTFSVYLHQVTLFKAKEL